MEEDEIETVNLCEKARDRVLNNNRIAINRRKPRDRAIFSPHIPQSEIPHRRQPRRAR